METIEHFRQWEAKNPSLGVQMVNVQHKSITLRRAVAQGKICLAKSAFDAIIENRHPKGDALAAAQIAGILASKKTSDLIPLCHPLPLDQVNCHFEFFPSDKSIGVTCEVHSTGKTGVEMEALMGVQVALLTLYDFAKAVDPCISIQEVRLKLKEGGKGGMWKHQAEGDLGGCSSHQTKRSLEGVSAAVLTVSDRCSQGKQVDESGPILLDFLKREGAVVNPLSVVPDEIQQIQDQVSYWIQRERVRLILTTGGTGLSPRDWTPEAIQKLGGRSVPGLSEYLRMEGAKHQPMAYLSRGIAAVCEQTLIITLPGSKKAVSESVEALRPLLPHALEVVDEI